MADGFRADLELIANLVDAMARVDEQLATWLDNLDTQIATLHTTWTGDAAAAHERSHQRWSSGAQEMRAALAELRAIADTARSNYLAAMTANREMWAR